MTIEKYGYNGLNDSSDAFRHSYWNALITKNISPEWAKVWTDAHEYGVTDNNETHQAMDLFNNECGRNAASTQTNLSTDELADYLVQRVSGGGMLIIEIGKLISSH